MSSQDGSEIQQDVGKFHVLAPVVDHPSRVQGLERRRERIWYHICLLISGQQILEISQSRGSWLHLQARALSVKYVSRPMIGLMARS